MIYTIIGVIVYAFFDSWLHGAIGQMLNNMAYKNERRAKIYKGTFHLVGAIARIGVWFVACNYFDWTWYWVLWSAYTIWLSHEIFFKSDGKFFELRTTVTCEKWTEAKGFWGRFFNDFFDCMLVKLRDKTGIHLHYISTLFYVGLTVYIGFQL